MSDRQFIRLRRDTTGHAQLLEEVLPRIERFSRRFGGDPKAMTELVWNLYAQNSPLLGLCVAMEDDVIVGHVLATITQWDGRMVGWVNQMEMDASCSRPFLDAQLDALDAWVKEVNDWYALQRMPVVIKDVLMQTPRMSDAWSRHVGFDAYRLICRREVK